MRRNAKLADLRRRLDFLAEIAAYCNAPIAVPQKFNRLAQLLLELIPATDIGLIVENHGRVDVYTVSGRSAHRLVHLMPLADQLVGATLLKAGSELHASILEDFPRLNNLLLVPLPDFIHKRGLLGVINYPSENLLDEDVQVLKIVANQIAIYFRLEEAQLAEVDSRRLDDELVVTSQIQDSFLPTQMPRVPGLDFAVRLKPASHVGGDFYDIFDLPNGLAIIIGDVAGKGIPAALLSALIHATLKSEIQHRQEPADLLQSINRLIYDELDRTHTFITAFLAVLQTDPLRLRYASAGHTVTLLWQADSQDIVPLTSTGLPLGVAPQLKILQKEIPLQLGDVLLLYSDGITEAENENGRVFGLQAMVDLLTATHTASASQQIAVILDALDLHRGALPLSDDVAIFLTRVESVDHAPLHVLPFVYPAERSSARSLAMFARRSTEELEFADKREQIRFLEEWELAVSEIATNIVLHAYKNNPQHGRIQGRLSLWPDRVCLDLIDSGLEFIDKPPHVFSPENPPEGGYGLIIARQLLDVCEYTRLPGGRNHWRLEKYSGGVPAGALHADNH